MKFKYVVPLEILRIMGSASQIFDTKISIKTSLEVVKSRKTLTKNDHGSLWIWYVSKDLDKVILKQVLESKMGKFSGWYVRLKNTKSAEIFEYGRGSRLCIYVYVLDKRKENNTSHIYIRL